MQTTDVQNNQLELVQSGFVPIVKNSIDLFKRVWTKALLTMVLFIALLIPFYIVIAVPLMLITVTYEKAGAYKIPYAILGYALFFLGVYAIIFIATGFLASFYQICAKTNDNQKDDFFHFLKKPLLLKTAKVALATTLIVAVSSLLVLPMFYAVVPVLFISIIYSFHSDLTAKEIVFKAFKLGNKTWLLSFCFVLIAYILQFIGLLFVGFGLLITIPLSLIPLYLIYKRYPN